MMWIKGPLPTAESGTWSGQCYIPEEIDVDAYEESGQEDPFVQILLDIMSKPMSPESIERVKKGGYCG